MPYLGVTASEAGLAAATPGPRSLTKRLARLLAATPPEAPIVVLVHGYRFHPAMEHCDPHRALFAMRPAARCWKIRSWPAGLGFRARSAGLCIGFAWPAVCPHVPELLRQGRTGFAEVYDRAGRYGLRLADLLGRIRCLAPGRPVDILAHSLGARVALAALPHVEAAPGRIVLLGAAEYDARALEALAALGGRRAPEIYNVTSRANDFYDLMFECFAPRQSWRDRALGHGLPVERPDWIDLQVDRPDVVSWARAHGIPLTAPVPRLCHWSFYVRPGTFELYQAILRRRPGFDVAALRQVPCFADQEPRWSRVLPRLPRQRPALDLGADPSGA